MLALVRNRPVRALARTGDRRAKLVEAASTACARHLGQIGGRIARTYSGSGRSESEIGDVCVAIA